MEENNSKALIVGFYLSKFDDMAYEKLNFGNKNETHQKIGEILAVKSSSIKNMRDEFDPYHENDRAGWYQRPLRPSRQKVYNTLSDLSEPALREIVLNTLNGENYTELNNIIESVNESDDIEQTAGAQYLTRAITGKRAEEYFIENWMNYFPNFENIENRTLEGCGYDFKLFSENEEIFVEVKGMRNESGGILLTSKEWETAEISGEKYNLFIVSNVNDGQIVKIINNPFRVLNPNSQIQTVIQVNWNVPRQQIEEQNN